MFGKKLKSLLEMLDVKIDTYGGMESGKIDNIVKSLKVLAAEAGYHINIYDGSISKFKK